MSTAIPSSQFEFKLHELIPKDQEIRFFEEDDLGLTQQDGVVEYPYW